MMGLGIDLETRRPMMKYEHALYGVKDSGDRGSEITDTRRDCIKA